MAVSGDVSAHTDTDDDHCVVEVEEHIFVASKEENYEYSEVISSSIWLVSVYHSYSVYVETPNLFRLYYSFPLIVD
jgi:hypothetical protein